MKKTTFAIIVFLVAFAIPVGIYSLILYAGGDDGDASEESVAIGKDEENRAPQILSVPQTDVAVGEQYVYRVKASDMDGDELEFRLKAYPSWMQWDGVLMTLEGTPGAGDIGQHNVEIWVTDGSKVGKQLFQVEVVEDNGSGSDQDAVETEIIPGDEGVDDSGESSRSTDLEDEEYASYGLSSGSGGTTRRQSSPVVAQSQQTDEESVLGTMTELPDTAVFKGLIGIGVGLGALCVALFIWADGKWNISENAFASVEYARGKQVKMDMGSGIIVKKRKHTV